MEVRLARCPPSPAMTPSSPHRIFHQHSPSGGASPPQRCGLTAQSPRPPPASVGSRKFLAARSLPSSPMEAMATVEGSTRDRPLTLACLLCRPGELVGPPHLCPRRRLPLCPMGWFWTPSTRWRPRRAPNPRFDPHRCVSPFQAPSVWARPQPSLRQPRSLNRNRRLR